MTYYICMTYMYMYTYTSTCIHTFIYIYTKKFSGVRSLSFREWFRECLRELSCSLNSRSLPITGVIHLERTGHNTFVSKSRFFSRQKQKIRFFLPRVRGMSDIAWLLWKIYRWQLARWCRDGLGINTYMYLCIHDILYMHDVHVHVYIHLYIHTHIYIYTYI